MSLSFLLLENQSMALARRFLYKVLEDANKKGHEILPQRFFSFIDFKRMPLYACAQ